MQTDKNIAAGLSFFIELCLRVNLNEPAGNKSTRTGVLCVVTRAEADISISVRNSLSGSRSETFQDSS